MIRATDIHSVTDFTRNAKTYINQVKETRKPIALTVNGEAEVVIQDAQSYQEMVDALEHAEFVAAIRQGEADIAAGRVHNIDEVFEPLLAKYGLPD